MGESEYGHINAIPLYSPGAGRSTGARTSTGTSLTRAAIKNLVESRGPIAHESKDALRDAEPLMGVNKIAVEVIRGPNLVREFQATDDVRLILLPDFDWGYNPGKAGAAHGSVTVDPERLEAIVREAKEWTWRSFGLPKQLPRIPGPPRLPRATSPEAAKQQIYDALKEASGQRTPIVRGDGVPDTIFGRVVTPAGQGDVLLTDGFVDHLTNDRKRRGREAFANLILPSLTNPVEIWLQPHLINHRIVYRRAFIGAFEHHNTVFVMQEDRHGNLSWTFYPDERINRRRMGYLLYRR